MKTKILKIGILVICGMFFAGCAKADAKETPTITSRPTPLIIDPATPTPTITLEQEESPKITATNTPIPEQKATSTPVPTKKPTKTPTPTVKPTATPKPSKQERGAYQKGTLVSDGYESEWLGLKFRSPKGLEMYPQEELDETMRLVEEALNGELPEGKLPYEDLAVVYEMAALWPSEGLLIQVMTERLPDKSVSVEEYAEEMKEELSILESSNVTYIVDDIFYEKEIGGQEFLNFGYTTYTDEGDLRQENYLKKQDDRIILISITGGTSSEDDMQKLLDAFTPYR